MSNKSDKLIFPVLENVLPKWFEKLSSSESGPWVIVEILNVKVKYIYGHIMLLKVNGKLPALALQNIWKDTSSHNQTLSITYLTNNYLMFIGTLRNRENETIC